MARATATGLEAADHDCRRNGEQLALARWGAGARVVFDVGANRGDWTAMACSCCPAATIHAFEISTPTRARLRASVPTGRVVVADAGLWSHRGTVRVKHYPSADEVTSILDYPHPIEAEWHVEHVTTGDAYMAEADIAHVDYLKVDVEGGELDVLVGFGDALAAGRIGAIQFEHGLGSIIGRALLLDFHDLLEPLGYEIGRVRTTGVETRPHRLEDERFVTANYLAQPRTTSAASRRLRNDPSPPPR